MLFGLEAMMLSKRQEAELEVAKLQMLRLFLGVTRNHKIRNKHWDMNGKVFSNSDNMLGLLMFSPALRCSLSALHFLPVSCLSLLLHCSDFAKLLLLYVRSNHWLNNVLMFTRWAARAHRVWSHSSYHQVKSRQRADSLRFLETLVVPLSACKWAVLFSFFLYLPISFHIFKTGLTPHATGNSPAAPDGQCGPDGNLLMLLSIVELSLSLLHLLAASFIIWHP